MPSPESNFSEEYYPVGEQIMKDYYFHQFALYYGNGGLALFTGVSAFSGALVVNGSHNTSEEFANRFAFASVIGLTGVFWWMHHSLFKPRAEESNVFMEHVIESAVPHFPKVERLSPVENLTHRGIVIYSRINNLKARILRDGRILPGA